MVILPLIFLAMECVEVRFLAFVYREGKLLHCLGSMRRDERFWVLGIGILLVVVLGFLGGGEGVG